MTTGPIRRLPRDRLVRRSDARLSAVWIDTGTGNARVEGLSHLVQTEPVRKRTEPGSPVLIMLGPAGDAAHREVVTHAGAGRRVYVLVPPTWGEGKGDAQLLRAPTVLIRRVPEPPVSGIHSSGGVRLWIGGGWSLRLDTIQAEAFRQLFLRLFWHDATHEAWSGGTRLQWRAAEGRPFDVPSLAPDSPLQLVDPNAGLEACTRDDLVHLSAGSPPETTPRRLWFPSGGSHHERLATLIREGVEVVWEDRGLPNLAVGPDGGEVLLPGHRPRLSIQLNEDQAEDAIQVLEAPSRWRFGVDVRIGDPEHAAASFWLSGESLSRGLEHEQRIELPEVEADTICSVPETSPSTWPAPQPLALSVRYCWNVVPPRLPVGHKEDALIGRWREIDQDWIARVDRLREDLAVVGGERSRIGAAFSRLVGAMLGFERKQSQLDKQLATMQGQRPSKAGQAEAPAMLARLAELEDQTRALHGDLEDAEREAREAQEREKQEAAWRAGVDEANRQLPQRRLELDEAHQQQIQLDQALADLESELQAATKSKDLQARKRKLSDERKHLQRSIQKTRDTIAGLEEAAAKLFEFQPPARDRPTTQNRTGGRFVPKSSAKPATSTKLPEDDLPEVGVLRQHRGTRYLMIKTWDELEAGERAASRLTAKLVAPEDV